MKNYRVPSAKTAFQYLSNKKMSTKLSYRPKDSVFDVLNMSGGTGGAPIAEIGDPLKPKEQPKKHTFGESMVEA